MSSLRNEKLRNIAIIAHVDHGKTTLVDQMFKQAGVFREGEEVADRVMDSMDLERERGITIAAKNCAVKWKGTKINIVDTPGHSDFGGEVERALMMVDGVVLLVDSAEGPLPQTRFVLKKALEANLATIVVVNKIDRKDARPQEVLNAVYDLFIDLDARDEQIEFPVLYAVGRDGVASKELAVGTSLEPLFETIVSHIPGPKHETTEPFQMLVTNLGYSDYLGRLAIGKVMHGSAKLKESAGCIDRTGKVKPLKILKLQAYEGVRLVDVETADPGEIVVLAGVDDVEIGDTICTLAAPKALPRIVVDEPTVAVRFAPNTGPLSGKEGKILLASKIGERLRKEALHNVALQVEESADRESFTVKGRGEFQMVILLETMRREGFELLIGRPKILTKKEGDQELEPIERVVVDCDERFLGVVTEKMAQRKGKMVAMSNHGTGRVRMEFSIPSRGLIGYRNEFLTDTRGTGMMSAYLDTYEPSRGEVISRVNGSLVGDRHGVATPYSLFHLEPRGVLFIQPGDPIYPGMVVGEHNRDNDLLVNPTKEKKLTNIRAAGRDENIILTPVTPMSLEKAIEFIKDDELVEITPKSIRIRKVLLPAPRGD